MANKNKEKPADISNVNINLLLELFKINYFSKKSKEKQNNLII